LFKEAISQKHDNGYKHEQNLLFSYFNFSIFVL